MTLVGYSGVWYFWKLTDYVDYGWSSNSDLHNLEIENENFRLNLLKQKMFRTFLLIVTEQKTERNELLSSWKEL